MDEAADLLRHFGYADGRLYRKTFNRHSKRKVGSTSKNGYIKVKFKGKMYLYHRIVWLVINQKWPVTDLDHINHYRFDNRIENLREVSKAQNSRNTLPKTGYTSRFKGVCKRGNRWRATIVVQGIQINLGSFKSEVDAALAYNDASFKYHGKHGFRNVNLYEEVTE